MCADRGRGDEWWQAWDLILPQSKASRQSNYIDLDQWPGTSVWLLSEPFLLTFTHLFLWRNSLWAGMCWLTLSRFQFKWKMFSNKQMHPECRTVWCDRTRNLALWLKLCFSQQWLCALWPTHHVYTPDIFLQSFTFHCPPFSFSRMPEYIWLAAMKTGQPYVITVYLCVMPERNVRHVMTVQDTGTRSWRVIHQTSNLHINKNICKHFLYKTHIYWTLNHNIN